MVFNQTISEFTECHVTAFHPMNIFKLNHYVIKFVSDWRQVGGFLPVLRFPPPIKMTATI